MEIVIVYENNTMYDYEIVYLDPHFVRPYTLRSAHAYAIGVDISY